MKQEKLDICLGQQGNFDSLKSTYVYYLKDKSNSYSNNRINLSDYQENPEKAKQEATNTLSDLMLKLNGMKA